MIVYPDQLSEFMATESSLSVEETNKIRIQLGLKPIVIEDTKQKTSENEETEQPQFISKDKVFLFRQRVSKLKDKLEPTSSTDNNNDWLNGISKNRGTRKKQISIKNDENMDDVDLPILNVSQDITKFANNKNLILTLKETEITDSMDNDTIEHEKSALENDIKKNLKLRTMNKDRKRKKLQLDVSSKDIEEDEKVKHRESEVNNVLIVGSTTNLNNEKELHNAVLTNQDGKIKAVFNDSEEGGDSDVGDYKPIKIKKRKKIKEHSHNRRKITAPTEMRKVILTNLEESDIEGDELFNIRPVRKGEIHENTNKVDSRNEDYKENDKLERSKELHKLRNVGMVIDENTAFFDALQSNILLSKHEEVVNVQNEPYSSSETHLDNMKSKEEGAENVTNEKSNVDFFRGLASTVNLLKDYQKTLPVQEQKNVLKDSDDEESPKKIVDLKEYNPDVQLNYKDKKGNTLTTKEAYKLLSQKFHGTKSNKLKKKKFEQKIKERNRMELK